MANMRQANCEEKRKEISVMLFWDALTWYSLIVQGWFSYDEAVNALCN